MIGALVVLLLLPLCKQKQQHPHHWHNGQHYHSDVVAC
jgi:hypothetical protein